MSWFYRHLLRPLLFLQDSEAAHDCTLRALGLAGRHRPLCQLTQSIFDVEDLPVEAMGLRFPNPVGLGAGMDKQGVAVPAWRALGFGFSELGGVTWHAQAGNPQPRMFRVLAEGALVNRMGFNNGGAPVLAARLQQWRASGLWPTHPVGINLGKSKITPLGEAVTDYANSFRLLWPLADFFVVNVSSPNTPNLRQLQDKSALDEILAALQAINRELGATLGGTRAKPLLVKIAPDLSFEALDEIVEVVQHRQLAGIVATNTTIGRPTTLDPVASLLFRETGGLSGCPLRARSTEVVRHLFRSTKGQLPLIGVGGIASAADAWEKVLAGASLVQVYSGLVYEGPTLIGEIVEGLRDRLAGANWQDVVGANAR